MIRAFIIRPFGVKNGVDFDAVDAKLIQPALAQIGIAGNTTTEIVEQGNIREDMFRLLVCADLVIADVSIHNANVFYELGIRHGMRPNATFLLRASIDEYPFDLRTDRYLAYDQANPAASVAPLAARAARDTGLVARRQSHLPGAAEPEGARRDRAARRAGRISRGGRARVGGRPARRPAPARARGLQLRLGKRRACASSAARNST